MSQQVVIYTKDWCGFCHAAKQLLGQLQLDFEEIDVTHDQEKFQEMLDRADGRRTVPQIFIDGNGIGGYSELVRLVQQAQQQQQQ